MTAEGWREKEIICTKWVSDRKKLGKGWDGEVNITIMIFSFASPHSFPPPSTGPKPLDLH